ncbi:MAG: TlpA family protein disulfide reductase [Candidatus Thorarchaeota archaeon]|nr:TlpA family protein disulfide reductase [Candidatus Thorarchaeota archaeon]
METKQLFAVVLVMSIVVVGITGATLFMNSPEDTTTDTTTTSTTDTTTTTDPDDDNIPAWFFRDQDLLPYNVTIPNWEFEMVDADNVTMESMRGKFVVMIFMATWCPACEYQNMDNIKLYEEYPRDQLEYIQLTTAQGDSPQMVRDYVVDHELQWNIGYASGTVGDAADDFLKLRYIPTLVLIDQLGTLRWIHEGTWRFVEYNATVSSLMG